MFYSTLVVSLFACLHFSDFVYLTSRDFENLNYPFESFNRNMSLNKRAVDKVEIVILKIFASIDYSVYIKWLNMTNKDTKKTDDAIRFHYAHIINGIREIYKSINTSKYRYDVKIVKFVIAKTKGESITENQAVKIGDGVIDYLEALNAMKKWAIDRQRDLPSYAIFVLFTMYHDLYSDSPVAGKSFLRTACFTGSSVAIIRTKDIRATSINAAHEIGHNLGARHDGDTNVCSPSGKHIMSPKHRKGADISYTIFSTCSISYFKGYVDSISSPIKAGCLGVEPSYPVDDTFSNYLSVQPGEKYTPDQQCQQAFGLQSIHCPNYEDEEELCHSISCTDGKDGFCYTFEGIGALSKTKCGKNKSCYDNRCVYDSIAKYIQNGTCRIDAPSNVKYDGELISCLDVTKRLYLCYYPLFKKICCKTCVVKNKPADCLYGDKDKKLSVDGKTITCKDIKKYPKLCETKLKNECCETCSKIK